MPRRLPAALFVLAFAGMLGALGWLFHELASDELLPAAVAESTSAAKRAQKLPAASRPALLTISQPPPGSVSENLAASIAEALQTPGAIDGEVLLTLKSPEALEALRARAAANGLEIISIDPRLLTARVRYRDLAGLQQELGGHAADYAYAGPNLIARIPGLPATAQNPQTDSANAGGSAPFRSQGLDLIGASANRTGWGSGVTVAVLDSGVTSHPSLQNTAVTHIDLVNDGETFHGHGTAMASLIAGNDSSVNGVSPASKILDVRIADPQGTSNTSLLSSGIVRAVDSGAQVINISLGSLQNSPVLEQAVRYAQSRGVVVVAAAGNEQMSSLSFPAGISGVVSVAAVNATGAQAWFSNSGAGLSLAAPGVGIISAYVNGKLVIGSGTSQAAAITSGVAAYLIGRGYQGQNVPTVLIRSARPTGAPTTAVGAGILRVP